jgi:hypothetical protein
MTEPLSVAENRILTHLLTDGGAVEESQLDADVLRSLEARGLVRCLAGFAIISNLGRKLVKSTPAPETPWIPAPRTGRRPGGVAPVSADPDGASDAEAQAPAAGVEQPAAADTPAAGEEAAPKLNPLQEDLLRRAVQGGEPLALDDLDGRVVRALEGRALVRRNAGVLEVTEAGRAFYERHVRRRRRARSGWLRGAGPAAPPPADAADERRQRADELRRAIAALEQALSDETQLEIGDLSATAADALAGLRELADRVERGEDPRRIPRNRRP